MLKRFLSSAVCILLAVSITGCSLFVPHKQSVTVRGEPAGATVIVNGERQVAPAMFRVSRRKNLNVMISKKGYSSYVSSTGYSLSPWGILDIIGGVIFLVPFIGLVSPGAYELDQDNFYYVLTPAEK